MPYNGGDLYVKVEAYINGAWVEITTRARGGRAASGIQIERGRGTSALQAETARCELTLGNADAYATEGNPESPWYPYFGRGCRIRVSISGVAVSDAVRFDGEIDTIVAVYPGGSDSSVRITATGILGGTLGLGADALRSPLFRTMAGVAEGDYVPHAYWPLEDGSDATQFASGLPGGQPMTFSGDVQPASDSDLIGSAPLPAFADGGVAVASVPAYTATTKWVVQFAMKVDAEPAAETVYAEFTTTGSARTWQIVVTPGATAGVGLNYYNSSGSLIAGTSIPLSGSGPGNPSEAEFFGTWALYTIGELDIGAGDYETFFGFTIGTSYEGGLGFSVETGTHGSITGVRLRPGSDAAFGHIGVWTDPNFNLLFGDIDNNASAMFGHVGELAHDRVERLCREEAVLATITGTSTQTMGAQETDTLANLLIECEAVDGGLLSDSNDGGGLDYRCLSGIVNQTASLAVTQGSLDINVAPIWDNRNIRNDVRISRPGGSSARVTDEAHIARTRRRIKDSDSANVETDEQLPDQAGWRVNVGTADGPRYNGVGINLRNSHGALLADAVLALEAGDRFTAAEATLPTQHPPGGIDGLVIGWREELDKDKWLFAPNVVPYAPYLVAELDDDDSAKLDTDSSDLTAAVDSDDTTLSVATQTGTSPLWTTDGGEVPIPLTVGGEVMSATAIAAPTTITYGAVGTATHASNASVTPGIPASVAAGNLLIVLAAIRNSGTGVPDTPSGYTRLDVFDESDNVQLFAKVAVGGDVAPTITFTDGVANATTSAQMIRIAGAFSDPSECFVSGQAQLNSSAQDIAYPALLLEEPVMATAIHNAIVIWVGWKQDDWTSVAAISGATEIAEASTTTGDDQALVWDYTIQTTATDVREGSFTVTGGLAAISRGAVFAVRSNVQTFTVTRSVNGVTKSHAAGTAVNVYKPWRFAL